MELGGKIKLGGKKLGGKIEKYFFTICFNIIGAPLPFEYISPKIELVQAGYS